jgi:hypothetical protein
MQSIIKTVSSLILLKRSIFLPAKSSIGQQSLSVSSHHAMVNAVSAVALLIVSDARLPEVENASSLHVKARSASVRVARVQLDQLPETASVSSHLAMASVSHG